MNNIVFKLFIYVEFIYLMSSCEIYAQTKLFDAAIHKQFQYMLEGEVSMDVGSENLIVHTLYSPFVTMKKQSREKKYWKKRFGHDTYDLTGFLCYTNNGKWIVRETNEESEDGNEFFIVVYDAATMDVIYKYPLYALTDASSDGKNIFARELYQIAEFNVNTGTLDTVLRTDYKIRSMKYPTKSDFWIVIGEKDGNTYIIGYRKNDNNEVFRINTKDFLPFVNEFDCDISDDGETLIAVVDRDSDVSRKIIGYSLKNRRTLFTYNPNEFNNVFYTLSLPKISDDGKKFVILTGKNIVHANTDGSNIKVVNINNPEISNSMVKILWLDDKRVVLGRPNDVVEFNTETNQLLTDIILSGPYEGFSYLPDKKSAIFCSINGITAVNLIDKSVVWKHNVEDDANFRPHDIHVKSERLVYILSDRMFISNTRTGEILDYAQLPISNNVTSIRFSQSGNKILFSERDSLYTLHVYDVNSETFSKIRLTYARGNIIDIYFEDETSNEIVTVHQFGVLVSNKEGIWLSDSSPKLTMALPTRLIIGEYHVRSGYGKIMSDNNSYMIGLYEPSVPLIRSSQIVCQERKTGKNINIFRSDDDDDFTFITLSNNDKYLSAISGDSIKYTWDILSGQRISKQKLAYSIDKVIPGAFVSVSPYDPSIVAMIADSGRFIAYSQSFTTSISQETIPTMEIESYPQPIHINDGHFFMRVPMADIESISAISVLGEIVPLNFVQTDASTYRILLPSLSRGHYTVQIKTQSGQAFVHSILIL